VRGLTSTTRRAVAVILAAALSSIVVGVPAASTEADGAKKACEANGGVWNPIGAGWCESGLKHGGTVPAGDKVTIPVNRGYGGEPPRCFRDAPNGRQEIRCAREHGVWNGTCYVQRVDPSTVPNISKRAELRDLMRSHDGEGVVIGCYTILCDLPIEQRPDGELLECVTYNWAPNANPVDPAQVAEEIWARLGKRSIDIGVAPYDDPDHAGYVGIGTWYWVEDYGPETAGPLEDSDSAQGFTVAVDTRVEHIEWDLGNGEVLICPPDSMPFETGKNLGNIYPQGSPDCGYVFEKAGTYTITATSVWADSWTGLGRVGTRLDRLPSETTIRIGENQALRQ
jgi:hypothetical protein